MKKTIYKSFNIKIKLFKRTAYFTFFIERDWYDACFSLLKIELWRVVGDTVYPILIAFEYFAIGFSVYLYDHEITKRIYEESPF